MNYAQIFLQIFDFTWLAIELVLHLAAFLLVTYHCLKERREPTSALLWIFTAWAFPVFGPLLFVLFGINYVERKGRRKHAADQHLREERRRRKDTELPMQYWRAVHEARAAEPTAPVIRRIHRLANTELSEYPLLDGNAIEPLVDGDEAYPRMRAAIQAAQKHIHLQTFIIGNDSIGREFLDLLAAKAAAGVQVRVLFDRFGSTYAVWHGLFRRYRRRPNFQLCGWTQANVLRRQFQINLRNHRKIMVVDGTQAFVGGINLHIENIARPNLPPIRDYHFHVQGPIVQELQYSFLRDWHFMTEEDPQHLLQPEYFPQLVPAGKTMMRLINSGPTPDEKETIADIVFECLAAAQEQILAVTPYFVPNSAILRGFRAAALRGVDVRLLVPLHNNHVYAGLAGRACYDELLAAGVRIFQRHPPFMHAKAILVDNQVCLVGSANLDIRSLRLNYETNLLVFDEDFAGRMKQIVLADFAASDEIDPMLWQRRPLRQRLAENFFHLMAPIL